MNVWQAIALGALQGATEFLPVSSSGHLVVMRELFGVAEISVLFDVLLHVATLVAVCVVLRRRIGAFFGAIGRALARRATDEDRPYLVLIPIIVVTTAITGIIGVGLDALFDIRDPRSTSLLFIVTAVLLVLTLCSRGARRLADVSWRDALVLGVAQGFGVLPGISRSGVTISTALYSGLDRTTAGEYSFLLSIPAILGALVLTVRDAGELGAQAGIGPVVAGCITAALVGFAALKALLGIVRAGKMYLFAIYLVPLGVWGLIFFR